MTLRLAFLGTPRFAVPTLATLIGQGHDIVCVYCQPPRPKGRGLGVEPSPVHALALAHGIDVRTPQSLKEPDAQSSFSELALDVAVVVAYGLILPKPILAVPRHGCINLHGSLLPRWRGAAPIQRAIMAGDETTGVMSMQMDEGLDTGPIFMAESVAIGRRTYGELSDELARLGADLMARTLGAVERDTAMAQVQSDVGAIYAKKISKEETRINWGQPARMLDCLVRGLSPAPGAWCEVQGERLKVLNCELDGQNGPPGTVLDDGLLIACGTGSLRLTRVQRPGKAAMSAEDLLRGFSVARGHILT